jgi:hypothetical protein
MRSKLVDSGVIELDLHMFGLAVFPQLPRPAANPASQTAFDNRVYGNVLFPTLM